MLDLSHLFALAFQICAVVGDAWNPLNDCLDGITTDITSFVFSDVAAGDYYATMCNGTLSTISLWAAAKTYCNELEIASGSKLVQGWCVEYGSTNLVPYAEVEPLLTEEFLASLPVVKYEDIAEGRTWNTSILLSKELFMAGYKTSRVWNMEYQAHHRYGWAVFGFWGGIVLIGMIYRGLEVFQRRHTAREIVDEETEGRGSRKPQSTSVISRAVIEGKAWFRTHVILPTTYGVHHRQALLYCTIPTRMESLIIFLFWALNVAICCATYELFFPNLYYTKTFQAWRYISDRTGIICFYSLPWLWIFAGRNNIFIWLTGWSFQTFNMFHKHIARLAVLQAIIHSIGYTVLEAGSHELTSSWKENYWYMGGIATIAMSLLLIVSSMIFRQKCYDVFLLLHIGLSVLALVGLFYHVKIFDGEYTPYLWPLVAIWVLDRTVRLTKLGWLSINRRFWSKLKTSTAKARYDAEADLIRLTVTPGSDLLKPQAGQHYFLYDFGRWLAWENHPFTLADFGTRPTGQAVARSSESEESLEVTQGKKEIPETRQTDAQTVANSSRTVTRLTFLIRPHSGWTRQLKPRCSQSSTGTSTFSIGIEGPYGHHVPLHTFGYVLFIVGGTGISGALPYLLEHLRSIESRKKATITRTIKLVWAAKQVNILRDVAARELRTVIGRSHIDVQLHCTAPIDMIQHSSTSAKIINIEAQNLEHNVQYCRPDVPDIVLEFLCRAQTEQGAGSRTAVFTCGPPAMADASRAAVHQAMKQGFTAVEYFEEAFGW